MSLFLSLSRVAVVELSLLLNTFFSLSLGYTQNDFVEPSPRLTKFRVCELFDFAPMSVTELVWAVRVSGMFANTVIWSTNIVDCWLLSDEGLANVPCCVAKWALIVLANIWLHGLNHVHQRCAKCGKFHLKDETRLTFSRVVLHPSHRTQRKPAKRMQNPTCF